ncbi:MAG: hypothetical protein Q9199_001658 [Rusavskia elegans]
MAYSIASIKGVLEMGKAVLQGSLSPEEYLELNECIVAAEEKLHEYWATSGQKLLFAPEYSTIRMIDELGDVAMQRLRSTNIKYAVPTPEDWHLVRKHEVAFEQQLVYSLEMWEFMRWFRRTHMRKNMPDLSMKNAAPPQLIITSFETYIFRNRDIGRPHHLDESLKLKAHHEAMRKQSLLLRRRKSLFRRLPAVIRDPNLSWQYATDRLLEKVRGWEKELVWGKAALELAEQSHIQIVIQ